MLKVLDDKSKKKEKMEWNEIVNPIIQCMQDKTKEVRTLAEKVPSPPPLSRLVLTDTTVDDSAFGVGSGVRYGQIGDERAEQSDDTDHHTDPGQVPRCRAGRWRRRTQRGERGKEGRKETV